MKILSVVGARPNFMKVAPIQEELRRRDRVARLVHTGQHYDDHMSDVFFRQLGLPEPDVYLGVGSGTHAQQTGTVMTAFEEVVAAEHPDLVLVVGDVNSTLACAIVAAKAHVPLAHVEAGLRSFDMRMPEEVNRVLTDRIADHLFVTEPSGIENLRREGMAEERIHFVGNVMIDTLVRLRERARGLDMASRLGVPPAGFVLTTLHRPSNVDAPVQAERVTDLLVRISGRAPVVFPMHPRTRKNLRSFGLLPRLAALESLILLEPLGYLEFLGLMQDAAAVVTDSGGIQEETTFLGVPCLTLRANTERPITVERGTNELVPLDAERVAVRLGEIMAREAAPREVPPLWDGHAAERIVDVLVGETGHRSRRAEGGRVP